MSRRSKSTDAMSKQQEALYGRDSSLRNEVAYARDDIRQKVVEEGWFGRQMTPSTQSTGNGQSAGEVQTADPLGRTQAEIDEMSHEPDRELTAREMLYGCDEDLPSAPSMEVETEGPEQGRDPDGMDIED